MNTLEPMSDDDLERVVRAIYRREEAPIPTFEESWAALEAALTARQTAMSAPTEAQAPADIHATSSDSTAGSDTLQRDIPPRGLQRARRFVRRRRPAGRRAARLLACRCDLQRYRASRRWNWPNAGQSAHLATGTLPRWRNSTPSASGPWTLNLQRQYRLSVRDTHGKRRAGLTAPLDHARSRRDLDATRRHS